VVTPSTDLPSELLVKSRLVAWAHGEIRRAQAPATAPTYLSPKILKNRPVAPMLLL